MSGLLTETEMILLRHRLIISLNFIGVFLSMKRGSDYVINKHKK
jgi:hypothetical protein